MSEQIKNSFQRVTRDGRYTFKKSMWPAIARASARGAARSNCMQCMRVGRTAREQRVNAPKRAKGHARRTCADVPHGHRLSQLPLGQQVPLPLQVLAEFEVDFAVA